MFYCPLSKGGARSPPRLTEGGAAIAPAPRSLSSSDFLARLETERVREGSNACVTTLLREITMVVFKSGNLQGDPPEKRVPFYGFE